MFINSNPLINLKIVNWHEKKQSKKKKKFQSPVKDIAEEQKNLGDES